MKLALIYAKYVLTIAAFVGYLVFAFRINESLKPHLTGLERGALVSLSVVGAAFLIMKAAEFASRKLFGDLPHQ